MKNNVDFSKTSSCYNPQKNINCNVCDACLLRNRGFEEAKEYLKNPGVVNV